MAEALQREISRAQVNELPIRRYEGEVLLVESPADLERATARAVYLFRLQHQDFGGAIAEILSSQRIVKAGVGLAHDLRELRRLFASQPASVVDLRAAGKRRGGRQTGLRNLAG